jgi:predicted GIY-YIG superfamily endonuclease
MSFWACMLHCNAGRFYVGHTDDLERRIAQHQSGVMKGFTRSYLPVTLVWSQEFGTGSKRSRRKDKSKAGVAQRSSHWYGATGIRSAASPSRGQAFDKLRPNGIFNGKHVF